MQEIPYLRLLVVVHAVFAGMFYFLDRQHPSRFARCLAWSWAIEAVRAFIRLRASGVPDAVTFDWFAASDCLQVLANWFLLAGCADLAGVRLPRTLGRWYACAAVPLVAFNRYVLPGLLRGRGVDPGHSIFLGVFVDQVFQFIPVAASRLCILYWLFRVWRRTGLPGALIATVFCVPYAVIAVAYPFQYYYGYNPDWVTMVWFLRVLGFSVGLVMLVLNQQLDDLKKSESRLATAQASARLGSWELELSTSARVWSDELHRLFGSRPASGPPPDGEVLRRIHPDDREAFGRYYSAPPGSPPAQVSEFRLLGPGGGMAWLEARGDIERDPEGRPVRLTGTLQDVTEKKGFEEQFLRTQRVENLGLLAAGIAHDFNNVLTPMLMVGPILREELHDKASLELLAAVETSAKRGKALVRQILTFAHGTDEGRVTLNPEHVLTEFASLLRTTFSQSIRLELSVARDPWPMSGNPTQLHQVLLNLCINARDAMPDGGTLGLCYSNCAMDAAAAEALPGGRAGRFGMFEVRDTGMGIPEEKLAHIWDPFFTTKREEHGTGLGLSTVHGIVVSHGGFHSVSSAPGKGTTFRVFFPAADAREA